MVLPLLLYMYRLHLQYAMSIDMENLQNHLISVSRNLDEMENILENKIARGTTMVSNAYSDYRRIISKIRASLNELQIKKPEESKKVGRQLCVVGTVWVGVALFWLIVALLFTYLA